MWDLLKDFWLLFGRMFPLPTRPGLRKVGQPDRSSAVLVTCNFDLTVRKVMRTLERAGIDAWLLVAPTKGVNVWCAAGGGHFTTDTVVSILKTSGVAEHVDHRKLVLPQLAAAGVNLWSLKDRTDWKPRFGPARIEDLPGYLDRAERLTAPHERRVHFPLKDRLIMGTNLGFNSLLFFIVPMLVASVWLNGFWWRSIPLVFALAVLNSALVFLLPGKPGAQKGLALGVMLGAAFLLLSRTVWEISPGPAAGWTAWIIFLATYLGYDLPSWSPLWRADVKEVLLGVRQTQIEIVEDRCVGCHLCDVVCPVDVFAHDAGTRKYHVANVDACQACGGCVENCPTDAIATNFRAGICACPTCAVIKGVGALRSKASTQGETTPAKQTDPASDPTGCGCGPSCGDKP